MQYRPAFYTSLRSPMTSAGLDIGEAGAQLGALEGYDGARRQPPPAREGEVRGSAIRSRNSG